MECPMEQMKIIALTAKLDMLSKKKKGGKNRDNSEGTSEKYEWKKVAPKDVKETKLKNIRTYHWCIKHQMWSLHKAE